MSERWHRLLARLGKVEWDRLICDTFWHARAKEMFLGDRWVYACPRCKRTLARSHRVCR